MVGEIIWTAIITITACLTFFGLGLKWGTERSRSEIARIEAKSVREVCLCKHSAAMHDSAGCHEIKFVTERVVLGEEEYEMEYSGRKGTRPVTYDKIIDRYECPCVRYVGPHSTYAPELEG